MTDAYATYMNNFSANMSRIHGYAGAMIETVGCRLRDNEITTVDAAEILLALKKTMDTVFEERGEEGSFERIASNYAKYKLEIGEQMRREYRIEQLQWEDHDPF